MVNDNDIKAYEKGEAQINGKLPGFGGSYEADRQKSMVERAFGNGSPGTYSKKADVYIGSSLTNRNAQSL